ncbi:MAG: glycoside hydrolase family 18 protein, partial [Alistipes sp.]|nr:glycoside hydrolase family 18 protein [Alistipes sp.]
LTLDNGVAGAPPGSSNPTARADFFHELAAAVPTETARGKYFLTQSLWTGYGSAQNTPMVTNPRYDWFNILAFAAEDLTPGPHSSIWVTMEPNVSAWIGRGVAASKLVPIAPAFGLRYFGNTADYTWGNLWQFTEYIPYRTLCATYPNAPETNTQPVDNGLWYDGLADVAQKADYAQGQGWGGMGLWSVENDALEPDKSLMHQINVSLAD